jgi:uncharacterized cofD-like protein
MKNLNVVTIGGAGGQAQILKALRTLPGIKITGITPSTDSGGSTGILKEDYDAKGYLGDLTWCMAALCPDRVLAETLLYRYGKGALSGHSVKNILLLAFENVAGPKEGLKRFGKLCGLGIHRVLPVTEERTELCATLKMGNSIVSETNIDEIAKNPLWHPDAHAIKDIYLEPKVSASKEVTKAIKTTNWFIICPGDFYSSIVPTLLPRGIKEAVSKSKAKIILVLNIVNKKGETYNYTADDFVSRIEKYIGKKVDIVFCNNKKIPTKALIDYALENKIEFKQTAKNRKDNRIYYAPFAEVAVDGTLAHSLPVLVKEFKKIIK